MQIKSIETIYLEEFPAIIWVQVKTDSGLIGLGETFFGPRAVAGCVHEMFAPMLIGKDPLAIERHWRDMFDMAKHMGMQEPKRELYRPLTLLYGISPGK